MSQPRRPARTAALSLATALLVVVALASFGYGVASLLETQADRALLGSGVGILLLGYAILLAAVARGVRIGRRWSRAPAIATQLIQLPIAWSFRGDQTWWLALLLAAVSATVIVCVLLPSSTEIFTAETPAPEGQD